jgi:dTDP-4-amino-4,6-dideoxygalactose transaminase
LIEKLRDTPFPSWPAFTDEMVEAAGRVLRSGKVNYWTGDEGKSFEREFAGWVGTRHGVAMSNGTVAIEAALYAMGIGPGDEVVVTPRTFVASASAIVRMGAVPVFADVERESGNISAATVAPVLTDRTRAILAVHLAGWPVEMAPLMALAEDHNLVVIEDAAQAHGAMLDGEMVGSLGHLSAFSFCQDKIMTTAGEGGMVTCDDEDLFKRLWSFKDHGKGYDTVHHKEHPPGFRWQHEDFGTNFRMTEVQSVVGREALKVVDSWLETRRRHGARLASHLRQFDLVRVPTPREGIVHSYYRFYCYLQPERLKQGWDRARVMQEISALGVPAFSGSCSEIYREKAFEVHKLMPPAPLPVAHELGETSLMFLVHCMLTDAEMDDTCTAITRVFNEASAGAAA